MTTAHKVVRILMRGCALLFLFSVVAIPISAQTNKGTIKGTVTDQNGAVVQNAEITVTNVETNAVRTVNGGADGTYLAMGYGAATLAVTYTVVALLLAAGA